ncbi:MAG TPA: hypothetical protein ACFYEE_02225 [Candidatus Wujingus californicus]|uniref:hypothetical protein n=1 Tax=Candidatus Wujingus californicus TaxID=3367618 RepID=UPI0040270235
MADKEAKLPFIVNKLITNQDVTPLLPPLLPPIIPSPCRTVLGVTHDFPALPK